MKICFLFRGENERFTRGYMNSLDNIKNWEEFLFNDVISDNNTYDIVFHTYNSNLLEMLTDILKPKYSEINESISQVVNCKNIAKWLREHKHEYDRFVIIRFDILYKIPITKWKYWHKNGLFIINRDKHWLDEKLCSDFVFISDSNTIDYLAKAFEYTRRQAHQVSQYFYLNDIPFLILYDEVYNIHNHPLYFVRGLEEENSPSLLQVIPIDSILDKSVTYRSLLEKNGGEFDKKHCLVVINEYTNITKKAPEIYYLYTVFDMISFKSDYIDDIKKVYTNSRFIYKIDTVPTFTIEIDSFDLVDLAKDDFTPRDS